MELTTAVIPRGWGSVARIHVEHVFCRLGTPIALLIDNAGELDGHLMREIFSVIRYRQTTDQFLPFRN